MGHFPPPPLYPIRVNSSYIIVRYYGCGYVGGAFYIALVDWEVGGACTRVATVLFFHRFWMFYQCLVASSESHL